MEREYNRNERSYRPRRTDSRDDYQKRNEERSEKPASRNRFENNRNSSYAGRNNTDRRERSDSREKGRYQERPTRYSTNREERGNSGYRQREESGHAGRKLVLKRDKREGEEKRPRFFRKEENSYNGERRSSYKKEYVPRERRSISGEKKEELRQRHYSKKKILAHRLKNEDQNTELRLNRFISMGGVCSRRDADELIVAGRVKVNDAVVETVGQKVKRSDKVEVDNVQIFPEKKVYLVLNKPKDFVTTVEDPLERKTVMSLIEGACKERVYPVGRLDRQTTGVLLFTNDGDLAKKLTHPKYDHKKIYHVFLDKALAEEDFQAIAVGVELEDGFIKADEINYTSPDCTEVGIEIHSGKNRIVRRIFEHFGYQIVKLDRVYFAGITKKNIPRGKWRFLTSQEVNMLKVY